MVEQIFMKIQYELVILPIFQTCGLISTFDFRINEHVRLFIFKEKSYLCGLIRDCAFISFERQRESNTLKFFICNTILPNFSQFCKSGCNSYETYVSFDTQFDQVQETYMYEYYSTFAILCAYLGLCVYSHEYQVPTCVFIQVCAFIRKSKVPHEVIILTKFHENRTKLFY